MGREKRRSITPKPVTGSLKVFVCSTFTDLRDERQHVLEAIRRLKLEHESMEYFGARAARPIETCLQEVRDSDVLVIVVAHRYGSIVPGASISFAEAEYRAGVEAGKLCFVYFKDEDVRVLPAEVERDSEKITLLGRWKTTLTQEHTVTTFTTGQDLALKVATDLARTIHAKELASRTEDDHPPKSTSESVRREINHLVKHAITLNVPEEILLQCVRQMLRDVIDNIQGVRVRVVLIFSSEDGNVARLAAAELERASADILLEEMNDDGSVAFGQLSSALASADLAAVFLSRCSTESHWIRAELDAAIWRQISMPGSASIVPIVLEDVDIPALLRTVPFVDLRGVESEEGFRRIIAAVDRKRHEVRRVVPGTFR